MNCSVDGCERGARARGWCHLHYQRWQRTGNPTKLLGRDSVVRRDTWDHGSRRGYATGCRCFPCRMANNRYLVAHARGERARIPASEVAAHLKALVASGWTRRDIADEAGVGATTPWTIMSGRVASVNSRTAAALLSVAPLGGTVTLDSQPLTDAVLARGVPLTQILDDSERRLFYRARESGRITDVAADRLAVKALSMTLDELYGPTWDEVAA